MTLADLVGAYMSKAKYDWSHTTSIMSNAVNIKGGNTSPDDFMPLWLKDNDR